MKYWILLLSLSVIACSNSRYPDFSKYSNDLYYQRLSLGEGTIYHPDSCFLDYTVSIKALDGSTSLVKQNIKFARINPAILKDSILKDLQKGDMLKLIVINKDAYLKDLCMQANYLIDKPYEIDFKVDEVYNIYEQEEDPNVLEFKSIQNFLGLISSPNLYQYINGIWMKDLSNNEVTTQPVKGEIVLDYKGYSLLGDSLDIPEYPIQFNTADQYQVIPGIEIALQHMHFEDSVLVIIPSYLAFGELGSKNGNVPPYTALMYYLKAYPFDAYQASHELIP
jgi:hypothetical protein